jgi:tRNA(Ile)-lysidine synthase
MRQEVIPKLASLFNPQLPETLARTVTLLQDENDWMTTIAREWTAANGVDAAALEALPVAFARRVVRMALPLVDLRFEHVETVRTLKSGKTALLPGGWIATREFSTIVVRQPIDDRDFCYELAIPGVVHVPELGKTFTAEVVDSERPDSINPSRVFADGDRLGPYVKIRSWQPGDYYRPIGWPGGKVKKLFQRARVPRSQRKRWPVFDAGSTIVWIASFPVSREFAPCGSSQKIVAFEALPD